GCVWCPSDGLHNFYDGQCIACASSDYQFYEGNCVYCPSTPLNHFVNGQCYSCQSLDYVWWTTGNQCVYCPDTPTNHFWSTAGTCVTCLADQVLDSSSGTCFTPTVNLNVTDITSGAQ